MLSVNKYEYTNGILDSVESVLTAKPQKGVLSKYSAAALGGFSNLITGKIDVTFPQGQKSSKITEHSKYFNVHTRNGEKYEIGKVEINYKGKIVYAYDPERTIIEIIKEREHSVDDVTLDIIKRFVKTIDYDRYKIFKYAKLFNIESVARFVLGVL